MLRLKAFRRLVFWSNAHSMLYESMLQSFVEDGVEVAWVAQRNLESFIIEQGQTLGKVEGGKRLFMTDTEAVDRLVDELPEETVHIFVGFSGHDTPAETMLPKFAGKGLFVGFIHENRPRKQGLKSVARHMLFSHHAMKNRQTMRFLMVQGYNEPMGGREYFRSVGFPDEKLFPFGYFGRRALEHSTPLSGPFRILFAGQHITRKGGDLLIKALADIPGDWILDMVGDGAQRGEWEALVQSLGLEGKVRFLGNTPHHLVIEKFREVDLFVLPSRFDGWGMVTNEALYQGVPAIISDTCGSTDLLIDDVLGGWFPQGNVASLRKELTGRMDQGKRTEVQSYEIWKASERFTGRAAATYLGDVIKYVTYGGPTPVAPWLEPLKSGKISI